MTILGYVVRIETKAGNYEATYHKDFYSVEKLLHRYNESRNAADIEIKVVEG